MPENAPVTMTDAAAERVKALLARRQEKSALGLRLAVTNSGCSGHSYKMEYVDDAPAGDEVVEVKGITLFIDPAALMFLIGSEIDYVEDTFQSGFVFKNPNVKGTCGCGESFSV